MPEYEVSVLVDGWARVRIQAENRRDALAALRVATAHVTLHAPNHEQIGEVENPAIIYLDPEDITLHQSDEETRYHAPVSQQQQAL